MKYDLNEISGPKIAPTSFNYRGEWWKMKFKYDLKETSGSKIVPTSFKYQSLPQIKTIIANPLDLLDRFEL